MTAPTMPADSRDMVEDAARDIWRFFRSEPEWFDANKSLGGPQWLINRLRDLSSPARGEGDAPVEVTIFCPICAVPHVDEGEWATTRHHKTHQCQGCGHEWRPFPFATVGIAHPAPPSPGGADGLVERLRCAEPLHRADGEWAAGAVIADADAVREAAAEIEALRARVEWPEDDKDWLLDERAVIPAAKQTGIDCGTIRASVRAYLDAAQDHGCHPFARQALQKEQG